MPSSAALRAIGLGTMANLPNTSSSTMSSTTPIMSILAGTAAGLSNRPPDTVIISPGAPALKRSMVQLMCSGAYIELGELPPAKGFSKPLSSLTQGMDGQVVLLQATDLAQSRKLIPDIATWVQCFALYATVLISKAPERGPALFSYMATICKFSRRYKWPSWIVYDEQFRQEAAETGKLEWAKVDGGIHSYCFNGQCIESSPWCSACKSLSHTSDACPLKSASGFKRPLPGARRGAPPKKRPAPGSIQEPCRKWNRPDKPDCPFGDTCIYQHICQSCKAPDHAESSCPRAKSLK